MKTFFRLLGLLRPFSMQMVLAIVLGCVMIGSNVGMLAMAAYLISAAALEPLLVTLTIPIYIVRFTGVARAASRYVERLVSHDLTFRLLARIRGQVYSALEPLLPATLRTYRSGDMLARLVTDVDELQHIYLRLVGPLVVAVVIAVGTALLFAIFSPLLAWVALAFLLTSAVVLPLLSGVLARGLGSEQLGLRAQLNTLVVDSVQGMQDLLACGRVADRLSAVAGVDRGLERVQRRMARVTGTQEALHDLVMKLALWTMLLLAIPFVSAKVIGGVYLAFLALAILASFEIVQPVAQALQFLGHSLAAAQRIFSVIDTHPVVVEPAVPLTVVQEDLREKATLEFERVSFTYASGDGEVLHDISFCIGPGSRVAIVGPSGSGKSTLVKLVVRFWDPSTGAVLLGGHDVREFALAELREQISVVAQDTHLFNDTLRNNLLLARPNASVGELERVLVQVGLADFVSQLPDGLETWIGEQGLRLSGGERQRLAIARALLKDAPVLLLDEATANLDPLTEEALLDALGVLMEQRTTLMITHRLIAMERMNEIIVLQDGRIVQRGTHTQLLKEDGLYRSMLAIQQGILTV